MDHAGALGLTAGDAKLGRFFDKGSGAETVVMARSAMERLKELAEKRACISCGTCCRTSSPTLYAEDIELIRTGGLLRERLYTLRAGEMVYSARTKRTAPLEAELVKVRERPRGGCIFIQGNKCLIYNSRPLQCRHLECWSGRDAGELKDRPRLKRAALYADDQIVLELAREYEIKLPAAEFARALAAAAEKDEALAEKALEFIDLDHRLRQGICARYGYSQGELELALGRTALAVARAHGLSVALDKNDRPVFNPDIS